MKTAVAVTQKQEHPAAQSLQPPPQPAWQTKCSCPRDCDTLTFGGRLCDFCFAETLAEMAPMPPCDCAAPCCGNDESTDGISLSQTAVAVTQTAVAVTQTPACTAVTHPAFPRLTRTSPIWES